MIFDQISIERLRGMGIDAQDYDQQLTKRFGLQIFIFQHMLESLWDEVLVELDNTPFSSLYAASGLPTDSEIHNSSYDFITI